MRRKSYKSLFIAGLISQIDGINKNHAEKLYAVAQRTQMIQEHSVEAFINEFKQNTVTLGYDDILHSFGHALRLAKKFSTATFDKKTQRDRLQIVADTTRGFLGELAVKKFFQREFSLNTVYDYSIDKDIEVYISTDIKGIHDLTGKEYKPVKTIGIKTSKLGSFWLDIGDKQYSKTDEFIFCRLGWEGQEVLDLVTILMEDKFREEWERIQESESIEDIFCNKEDIPIIPAVISGILGKEPSDHGIKVVPKLKNGTFSHNEILSYQGKIPKKDVPEGLSKEIVQNAYKFISINKFAESSEHYVASVNLLKRDKASWKRLINRIIPTAMIPMAKTG